jgi:leucyl-tRNA synthetase
MTYGEEQWKDFCMQHVKSENFQGYNPKTQEAFEETLNWLNKWACSRTTGLGTRVPWD